MVALVIDNLDEEVNTRFHYTGALNYCDGTDNTTKMTYGYDRIEASREGIGIIGLGADKAKCFTF